MVLCNRWGVAVVYIGGKKECSGSYLQPDRPPQHKPKVCIVLCKLGLVAISWECVSSRGELTLDCEEDKSRVRGISPPSLVLYKTW